MAIFEGSFVSSKYDTVKPVYNDHLMMGHLDELQKAETVS